MSRAEHEATALSIDPTYDPISAEPGYAFQRLLGFKLTAWEEDFARIELPFAEKLTNRYGIPHGGVYTVLIDTACGYCGVWCPYPGRRRLAMTLSLNTHFLGRPTGKMLIADARRTGGGKRSFFAEAVVMDENGVTLARGGGVFRYRGESGDLAGERVDTPG